MIRFTHVQRHELQHAFNNGADNLALACKRSKDGMSLDLLKASVFRGDYHLFAINGGARGWLVVQIVSKQTYMTFHVVALQGKKIISQEFWDELKSLASQWGCKNIEAIAHGAALRLYTATSNAEKVAAILRMEI